MFSFDSLTLKYFFEENYDFINGAIVQKIQLPSRHEVILNIRNLNFDKPQNKKLYININPQYPHICFIDENSTLKRDIKIPKSPPMFCMQLRKYLNGSKIKDFKLVQYERILEFYFDYFDEIGSLTTLCLSVELMGKHSNIILYNSKTKVITGSIHNISEDKSSIREIYGGINYIYPPKQNKLDINLISYAVFYEIALEKDVKKISENFYYFNQALLNKIFEKFPDLPSAFSFMQELQTKSQKDFILAFWSDDKKTVSEAVDEYFSNIIFNELMKNKKAALKKHLSKDYKKLSCVISKGVDSSKADKYKLFADLIMMNLYQIKEGQKEFIFEDNKIELDETLSINANAQKYYAQYKKAKTAFEYDKKRLDEAKQKLNYFESIIFNIENAASFLELNEIKQEMIEAGLIKEAKEKKQSTFELTKVEFRGFEIYIGKNNKQNDYLISKIANGEDYWFHAYNCPSAHIILKIKNSKTPTAEVLEFCAKLTKENSKAKLSGKTSIIYTKRKNLRKPPDTYLGYVTYKNEKEIII